MEDMKKPLYELALALGAIVLINGPVWADKTAPTADKAHAEKGAKAEAGAPMAKDAKPEGQAMAAHAAKPGKMMCEEFLALDEVSKPKIVYWAEGFNRKGKPDEAVFDVESTDRLVPTLIEVCHREPKASFLKKEKAASKGTP